MPRFLPISTFKSLFSKASDLLDQVDFDRFRQRVQSMENAVDSNGKNIDREAYQAFINTLREPGVVLYYDWVESNKTLSDLLSGTQTPEEFYDRNGILKHRYIEGFKTFISPYLSEELIRLSSGNEETRKKASSYFVLLDEDSRILIEDLFFKDIRNKLLDLKSQAKGVEEEKSLTELIHPLCSDENIGLINSFSKASYAKKLEYVDTILGMVRMKACTVRLANWILKEMEKVSLNKEHEYKIVDLRKELREGKIKVRNSGARVNVLRSRDMVTIAIVVLLGGAVFYLLYFKPFNESTTTDFKRSASFKKLTKEERKRVDSLLKTIPTSRPDDETVIDPNFTTTSGGPVLTIRKPFKNTMMEDLYEDLSRDARLQELSTDSCKLASQVFIRYPGVQDLSIRNGKVRSVFRNNSDYDAVLYVAEDKTNGSVYSIMIRKGEFAEVRLQVGDAITLVYGNHFTTYVAPNKTGGLPLPSSALKNHFCDTDVNYGESINISYRYADNTRTEAKFLITGVTGNYVQLVDVYDVLEDYGS